MVTMATKVKVFVMEGKYLFLSHPHIRSMWGMRYCASFTPRKCTHLGLPCSIATVTMEMHGREI